MNSIAVFLLTIFSVFHQMFGDLFAIGAVIGTFIMLLSPFDDVDWQVKKWGVVGFLATAVGQISLAVTGTYVEKIGFLIRLSPEYINLLLMLSFVFIIVRGWLHLNQYKFM